MLLTPWLTLLSCADRLNPAGSKGDSRSADFRNPWRHSETAYRSNPLVPPERVHASRGERTRAAELRWRIRQRQF